MNGELGIPRSRALRALKNQAFLGLCIVGTAASIAILAGLLVAIVWQGWTHLDLHFLSSFPSRRPAEAGFKAAIWGSVWVCAVCGCVAIPLGIATAIAMEEYRPRGRVLGAIHRIVELNVGNLAGVPSIVYGILGLTVFVRAFGLFGSPNTALYDEMLRVKVRGGEVIQADLVEERDDALVLASPVRGTITVPRADVVSTRRVYARTHHFRLDDGTRISGTYRGHEDGRITVTDGAQTDRVIDAARVARYSTSNMLQLGDPDGLFFVRLPFGGSVLAGGLTLALVVLPIVIVASREAIRAVPDSLRQGALATGATRWQTIWRMTLPASIPGIMTGSILSISRAIGEAAPLLVVGGFLFIMFTPRNLMDDFAAMPLQIFNWAGRPQEEFHKVAASGIVVLLVVLLAFNAAAIVVRQVFHRRMQ